MSDSLNYYVPTSETSPFKMILAGHTWVDSDYYYKRTNSGHMCIGHTLRGEELLYHGKERIESSSGDTYVLLKGKDHEFMREEGKSFDKLWISFSGPLAESLLENYSLTRQTLYHGAEVTGLFWDYIRVCKGKLTPEEKNDECAAIFLRICQRLAKKIEPNGRGKTEAWVLKDYIDMHLNEDIDLSTLAGVIYKSRSQVIITFQAQFGVTPYEYLLNCRVKQAKLLLSATDLLVKEISSQMGFPNEHYFSVLFKRKSGMTPNEYRKRKISGE